MELKQLVIKSKVLLIIPAYNEEKSIMLTIEQIYQFQQKQKNQHYSLDFIVINDGSTDGTEKILQDNGINHVNLLTNLGIGGAVQTGYKYALTQNYDIAVQFDADGQHDINSLDNIVQPIIDKKCNFCVGSRFIKNDATNFQSSFLRRFGIKLLSVLIKFTTGKKIYDVTSGYRAADKDTICFFSESYPVSYPEPESLVHLLNKNFLIEETLVKMFERTEGKSSISSVKSIKYMIEVSTAILISGILKESD